MMVAMGHGVCVCVCVCGETTKNEEESKILNVSVAPVLNNAQIYRVPVNI